MDTIEQLDRFKGFFEVNYPGVIEARASLGKDHVVVDFKEVAEHDPELASNILDDPSNGMQVANVAAEELSLCNAKINVRFKNLPLSCNIKIHEIRAKNINQILSVEGVVKQKSDIRPQMVLVHFECPSCGNIIPVLQLDERKFKEPSVCTCGRKSSFRVIKSDKIDVFSVLLEEPIEFVQGGSKLSKIKVLFKNDLCNNKLEKRIFQGGKVRINGVLKELIILEQGKKTSKLDFYLEANYIDIFEETYLDIKWNDEDVKNFQELAKKKDWLEQLRKSIFYDLHKHHEECEAAILQMFGGVGVNREGLKKRGSLHVLFIGDPGTAKSSILKIIKKNSPKAMYVAGSGATAVGLTAAVVRDELLGGYTAEAGAIVLCNNGLLCIDEMDKLGDEFKKALHEPLADETLSINKANVQVTMMARTSVLAAANPKYGAYSEYDSVYKQIDMPPALINRFDLVYPIKESQMSDDDNKLIAQKILMRGSVSENDEIVYSRDFVKKYVAYAKNIDPVMTPAVVDFLADKYCSLKDAKARLKDSSGQYIPITPRSIEGLARIVEAVARSRLHKKVTKEDAEIGYAKLVSSLRQLGVDPDRGDSFVERIDMSGVVSPVKRADLFQRVVGVIRGTIGGLTSAEIYSLLESEGYDRFAIDAALVHLNSGGDIIQPRSNGPWVVPFK